MWDQYEPPAGKPDEAPPPDPGLTPALGRTSRRGPIVAGGTRSRGAGAVIGLVAMVASIGIGLAVAGSADDPESDYSDFYACVAEQDGEAGLLSPADICEIGNERPPDYVDEYEYDPYQDDGGYDGFGDDNDSGY